MPGYPSLLLAAIFAAAGIVLNCAVHVRAIGVSQANLRAAAFVLGQLCWGFTFLICIIRGNIYASSNISEDGYGMIGYNIVKWGSVVAFLFFDSFLLERAYEQYFIFSH